MPPHYLLTRLRLSPAIQDIKLSCKLKRTRLPTQDLCTRNLIYTRNLSTPNLSTQVR